MPTDELTEEIYQGTQVAIAAYVLPDGTAPVKVALEEWVNSPHKAKQAAARHFSTNMKKRADGEVLPHKFFHLLDGTEPPKDSAWAKSGRLVNFKDNSSQSRILGFIDGKNLIVHYVVTGKNEDEIDPGDIKRAKDRRDEYFRRKAALSSVGTLPFPSVGTKKRHGGKK